tara:strand:- start:2773 stop:2943 length:171 start_codon:yes stop_codon:yes gene_type:complete
MESINKIEDIDKRVRYIQNLIEENRVENVRGFFIVIIFFSILQSTAFALIFHAVFK